MGGGKVVSGLYGSQGNGGVVESVLVVEVLLSEEIGVVGEAVDVVDEDGVVKALNGQEDSRRQKTSAVRLFDVQIKILSVLPNPSV